MTEMEQAAARQPKPSRFDELLAEMRSAQSMQDAELGYRARRLNAAIDEMRALVDAEEAEAKDEVEAKIAADQAQLATKQQRELFAFVLAALSTLPDADADADEFEQDCAD